MIKSKQKNKKYLKIQTKDNKVCKFIYACFLRAKASEQRLLLFF